MRNEYGLDYDYFERALNRIGRDLLRTRPSEMANMLEDLMSTAEDQMQDEPQPHHRNE